METKCTFHPINPSAKCRVCKTLGTTAETPKVPQLELKKPEKKHGLMPIWGDKKTWNISALMRKNVLSSIYFNELYPMRELSEVINEILKHAKSIEPWIPGTCYTPSSLFCCLIKLFMMKLTEGQIRYMIDHKSCYVRVAGFLYLRFLSNPQELWDRFNYYTIDSQVIDGTKSMTIGQFLKKILTEQDYYGLQLPRIPMSIQTIINAKCAQILSRRERFEKNCAKVFEKDSQVIVYLDEVQSGVFKHRDGDKVHVQVNGKDLHVSLGDIDDHYTYDNALNEPNSINILADSRKEYMKKPVSYKDALMFQISSKRPRSPSPEFATVPQALAPQTDLYSIDTPYKKQFLHNSGPEYFKLG
jgi:PRP38 family